MSAASGILTADDDIERAIALVYRISHGIGQSDRQTRRLCTRLLAAGIETPVCLAGRVRTALSPATDPERLDEAVSGALLADAMERLPPRQQLTLRDTLAGRTVAEIAADHEWTPRQVHRLLTYAMRSMAAQNTFQDVR